MTRSALFSPYGVMFGIFKSVRQTGPGAFTLLFISVEFLAFLDFKTNYSEVIRSYHNSGDYRLIFREKIPRVETDGREESTVNQIVELLLNIFLFPETNKEFVTQEQAHVNIFSRMVLYQQLVSWLFPVFMWTVNCRLLADSVNEQTQVLSIPLCACVDMLKRESKCWCNNC